MKMKSSRNISVTRVLGLQKCKNVSNWPPTEELKLSSCVPISRSMDKLPGYFLLDCRKHFCEDVTSSLPWARRCKTISYICHAALIWLYPILCIRLRHSAVVGYSAMHVWMLMPFCTLFCDLASKTASNVSWIALPQFRCNPGICRFWNIAAYIILYQPWYCCNVKCISHDINAMWASVGIGKLPCQSIYIIPFQLWDHCNVDQFHMIELLLLVCRLWDIAVKSRVQLHYLGQHLD